MNSLIFFKALADETRIRLFNILFSHELNVNELVYLMGMGQSRISRHLKILADSRLLQCRRDGIWAFYTVSKKNKENNFAKAIRFLFNDEFRLQEDLKNADLVINERNKKSKQFFNNIAHEWDDLQQQIIGDFDLNRAILKHVEKCRFAVDLGCGTGKLLYHLKDFATVTVGVDSSPVMMEQAKKFFKDETGNVKLRLGELEHLPIRDKEADFALISMVLHHLSDPEKVIAEVTRILNKKGKFVIADFEKHKNENMREKYGDRWLGFSREEIETLLSNNEFSLISMESFLMKPSLKLNIYKSVKN